MTPDADFVPAIASTNLSFAWAKVMLALAQRGVGEISPLTVAIRGFTADGAPTESPTIRTALDAYLESEDLRDCENVAFTIFPQSYWQMAAGDRSDFFDLYRESFQRIQDFAPRHNKRGSYFQRLVDYEGGGVGFNQLAWILDEYNARPTTRRSKWQATTFDPRRDLSAAGQLEFPCLQHVSFTFEGPDGLVVNAFYATQQMLRKAYGNYIGLSRLGAFMAHEMKRRLVGVNLFVGVAQLDNKVGKTDPALLTLLGVCESAMNLANTQEAA